MQNTQNISSILYKFNLFTFYVVVFLFIFSCNNTEQVKKSINDNQNIDFPDQIMHKLKVNFIDSNRIKAILTGNRARIYTDRKETWVDSNVFVEFYSRKNDKKESLLYSDSAKIDDRTKNMFAYGNVKVVKIDSGNTILTTQLLEWNQRERKLYSTEFIRLESPIEIIEGYGFESDQSLNNYKIFKVSGEKK